MNAQQELFSSVLLALKKQYKDKVFDGELPPERTPYPFIYVSDTEEVSDFRVKGAFFGQTTIHIHVWQDDLRKRGDLSTLMFEIFQIARTIQSTASYLWCLSEHSNEVIPDNSTGKTLIHGIVTLTYKHFRR